MKENLKFYGHDTVALAKRYGTPLYVFSANRFHASVEAIRRAFQKTKLDITIHYAGKAFLTKAMCKLVAQEGLHLDVASGGELFTALQAGFPAEAICFHGSNKSNEELQMALDHRIGLIVIDSFDEIDRLTNLTTPEDRVDILVRIAPGIEAHTHELIQTGKVDSKFGVPASMVPQLMETLQELPRFQLKGLHCHIGSQITETEGFIKAAEKMLEIYAWIQKNYGQSFDYLNLGGGFGIPYLPQDPRIDLKALFTDLGEKVRALCTEYELKIPQLMFEPGRYLAATAGVTLYTVGTIKEIPGQKTYVSVDGGMMDNPRPALYGAAYHAEICNGKDEDKPVTVRISGKACETDTLIDQILLNDPQVGDILMVHATGAYNYAMASNYNRLPKPAVVLLMDDQSDIISRRETYEDIVRLDEIPSWLED